MSQTCRRVVHGRLEPADYDFVWIIACEHGLASYDTIKFDVVLLNKALKADIRYKGAEDLDGSEAGTVFCKDYSPTLADFTKQRKVFSL